MWVHEYGGRKSASCWGRTERGCNGRGRAAGGFAPNLPVAVDSPPRTRSRSTRSSSPSRVAPSNETSTHAAPGSRDASPSEAPSGGRHGGSRAPRGLTDSTCGTSGAPRGRGGVLAQRGMREGGTSLLNESTVESSTARTKEAWMSWGAPVSARRAAATRKVTRAPGDATCALLGRGARERLLLAGESSIAGGEQRRGLSERRLQRAESARLLNKRPGASRTGTPRPRTTGASECAKDQRTKLVPQTLPPPRMHYLDQP